ncbi:MAG: hypothetical protein ABL927_04120 [Bdellovibrionales bacterium]
MKITSMTAIIFGLFFSLLFNTNAYAIGGGGGGGWNLGANIGFINASQGDMNDEITAFGSGASQFGNAWEGSLAFGYRMSGSSVALLLKPSMFYYSDQTKGTTSYGLSGFTVFPVLKWFMLEDQTIKFYSQFGVGYGHMSGEVKDGVNDIKFSGGDLGYLAGLGAEFCFSGSHCLNIEGSMRVLSVGRFTVNSASGTFVGNGTSAITQDTKDKEFEINGHDFAASMTGILGMIGYSFYF